MGWTTQQAKDNIHTLVNKSHKKITNKENNMVKRNLRWSLITNTGLISKLLFPILMGMKREILMKLKINLKFCSGKLFEVLKGLQYKLRQPYLCLCVLPMGNISLSFSVHFATYLRFLGWNPLIIRTLSM